jgi:sugar phosphate isomerase/epimerase
VTAAPVGEPAPALSVGEYTTPHLSFAEDLDVYRAAGAAGIGIDPDLKLGGCEIPGPEDVARFRDSGLTAAFAFPSIPSVIPLVEGSAGAGQPILDPAARVEVMCRSIRGLEAFEPGTIVCVTGPAGDLGPDRAWEIAVDGFARVARAADDIGAKLAVEPMHSSIAAEYSFLTSIPDTVRFLDDAGARNGAIMFDVWHLWDTDGLLEDIARHVDRIAGVHVNDRREPTRSWCDRVLPGDGIADVAGILGALDAAGYRGWYELEVMSDDGMFGASYPDSLWARDPLELVRSGVEKFHRTWVSRRPPARS